MKTNFRILSVMAFALAVPSLIIVDWYYKGYGVLALFAFCSLGLVFDQLLRRNYPQQPVTPLENYRTNKLLNLIALVLFVQSPMALIFGDRIADKLGFWLMAIMICLGIALNQIAQNKFNYSKINEGEQL